MSKNIVEKIPKIEFIGHDNFSNKLLPLKPDTFKCLTSKPESRKIFISSSLLDATKISFYLPNSLAIDNAW